MPYRGHDPLDSRRRHPPLASGALSETVALSKLEVYTVSASTYRLFARRVHGRPRIPRVVHEAMQRSSSVLQSVSAQFANIVPARQNDFGIHAIVGHQ